MAGTKFLALNQDDNDSGRAVPLQHLSSDPLEFSNTIDGPEPSAQRQWFSRSRGSDKKRDHHEHITYVSSPTDLSQESLRLKRHRRTTDRFSVRKSSSWLLRNPVSNFKIPRFAAPWQHEIVNNPLKANATGTTRVFDARAQRNRIFVNGFLQWLNTVFVVLLMFGTLYGFGSMLYLTRMQKYIFNACITLLSLLLGLAIVAALRAYARLVRWRFLAATYRNLQDFELVMNCDSQSKVLRLFWAGRSSGRFWLNKTQVLCLFSLSLVIGLQIVIGMLGLTYSVDTAEGYVDLVYGTVERTDLSAIIYTQDWTNLTVTEQFGASNQYGSVGQIFATEYDVPLGSPANNTDTIYTPDNKTYAYGLLDYSPDPNSQLWATTDRYVTADASCKELTIRNINLLMANNTLQYIDERGVNRSMHVSDTSKLSTTYMTNTSLPVACGPRCAQVLVLNNGDWNGSGTKVNPTQASQLLTCNVTVHPVAGSNTCANASLCEIHDLQASIWAGSIGAGGINYLKVDNYTNMQYKNWPVGSYWSWGGDTTIDNYTNPMYVAGTVSYFAIGAIAAYDEAGPKIKTPGWCPTTASTLNVEWRWSIPILCIVPGVQFLVLICVCLWANGAVIKDGSFLSTARLLRPIVEKLEGRGCALTGDEIAKELGNFEIIYGARAAGTTSDMQYSNDIDGEDAEWHLGIIAESEGYGRSPEEGWCPGRRFPVGKYDGIKTGHDRLYNEKEDACRCRCNCKGEK